MVIRGIVLATQWTRLRCSGTQCALVPPTTPFVETNLERLPAC